MMRYTLRTAVMFGLACAAVACGDDNTSTDSGGGNQGGAGANGPTTSAAGGGSGTGGQALGPDAPPGYACPTSGAPMVQLPAGFCIDATEVTRNEYQLWLDSEPALTGRPAMCAFNQDFVPACAWPPGNQGELPAACVDWCDAQAFCADAGKRLCGRRGGATDPQPNAYDDYANPALSQWFYACSSNGKYDYTYGDEHDPAACRGSDEDQWAWVDAGSLASCQSPDAGFAGVFDLSGNVMEWEDSCDAGGGADDSCRLRGGSFNYGGPGLRCDAGETLAFPRNGAYVGIGFRCCSP